MSKERKHIDNLFKEELNDFSLETSMADFDAIMEKMNKKKKRRVPFWWFFLGMGVLAIGSAILIPQLSEKEVISTVEVSENKKSIELNQELGEEIKDNTLALDSEDLENKEKIDFENEIITKKAKSKLAKPIESNPMISTSMKSGSKKVTKEGSKSSSQNSELVISGKPKVTKDLKEKGAQNKKEKEANISEKSPGIKKIILDSSKDSLPTKKEKLVDVLPVLVDTLSPIKKRANKKVMDDLLHQKWRLELMGSYLQSSRTMESSNGYADIRKDGEKNLATLNFGIKLHREFKSGFSFGTGLESNTFSNDASYSYERKKFDLLPVLNPNGDTIGHFKSNFRDTTEEFKSTNKIKVLRLPIQMSYRFTLKNSGFRIGGGLYGDYITGVKGELPEDENLIPTNSNQVFNQEFLLGWAVELGYFRPISKSLNLEIKTNYSASFTSLLGSNDAKDKPKLFGVGMGLSYKF